MVSLEDTRKAYGDVKHGDWCTSSQPEVVVDVLGMVRVECGTCQAGKMIFGQVSEELNHFFGHAYRAHKTWSRGVSAEIVPLPVLEHYAGKHMIGGRREEHRI